MQARKEMKAKLERQFEEHAHPERIALADIPFTRFLLDWLDMMQSSVKLLYRIQAK